MYSGGTQRPHLLRCQPYVMSHVQQGHSEALPSEHWGLSWFNLSTICRIGFLRRQTKPREGKSHPLKIHSSRCIDRCVQRNLDITSVWSVSPLPSEAWCVQGLCKVTPLLSGRAMHNLGPISLCFLLYYISSLKTIRLARLEPQHPYVDRLWGHCLIWHASLPTHNQVLTSDFLLPTRLPWPQK